MQLFYIHTHRVLFLNNHLTSPYLVFVLCRKILTTTRLLTAVLRRRCLCNDNLRMTIILCNLQ